MRQMKASEMAEQLRVLKEENEMQLRVIRRVAEGERPLAIALNSFDGWRVKVTVYRDDFGGHVGLFAQGTTDRKQHTSYDVRRWDRFANSVRLADGRTEYAQLWRPVIEKIQHALINQK